MASGRTQTPNSTAVSRSTSRARGWRARSARDPGRTSSVSLVIVAVVAVMPPSRYPWCSSWLLGSRSCRPSFRRPGGDVAWRGGRGATPGVSAAPGRADQDDVGEQGPAEDEDGGEAGGELP